MTAQILDGRAKFGCSLEEFYRRPELVVRVARRGVLVPPITDVATDAPTTPAYVNPLPDGSVRWIADCPDCLADGRAGAEYVWLDAPLLFCPRCGNRAIGGKWRQVVVPSKRKQIERLLLARPNTETRFWAPSMTLADLKASNIALGVGV